PFARLDQGAGRHPGVEHRSDGPRVARPDVCGPGAWLDSDISGRGAAADVPHGSQPARAASGSRRHSTLETAGERERRRSLMALKDRLDAMKRPDEPNPAGERGLSVIAGRQTAVPTERAPAPEDPA